MKLNNIFEIYNKTLKENLVNENLILEYAQGKNNKRAREFIKSNYPQYINKQVTLPNGNKVKLDAAGWTREIRDTIPASRFPVRISPETGENIDSCRLLLGVTRIYFDLLDSRQSDNDDISGKLDKLEQITRLITDKYLDKYDRDLNGLNFNELNKEFSPKLKQGLEKRKEEVKALGLTKADRKTEYTFEQIPNFKAASDYADYVSWCITSSKSTYNTYTKNDICVFYFCLKDGFETIFDDDKQDEYNPLDEYGKSMIAILVNEDGSLNHCASRHNTDETILTNELEVSKFFGVDFFETFKPRNYDEIIKAFKKDAIQSEIAKKQNGIETKDKLIITTDDKKIMQYKKCYDNGNIKCFAYDKFYWFNVKTGEEIDPPNEINGDFDCIECNTLTSIVGAPIIVNGQFGCSECNSLTSIIGAPKKVTGAFYCTNNESLISLEGAPEEVGRNFSCVNCTQLKTLQYIPKKIKGGIYVSGCESLTLLEGIPRKINGDFKCSHCISLTSLSGAPIKVDGKFDCTGCKSLTSLKGAPIEVRGKFTCADMPLLKNLDGAPKIVGGDFICSQLESLTSLKGTPEKVGRDVNILDCVSLKSLDGVTKQIIRSFNCVGNSALTSLVGVPEEIPEDFSCVNCKSLTSLIGSPRKIGGYFTCTFNKQLTSLEGGPEEVGTGIDCSDNPSMTSLKGAPRVLLNVRIRHWNVKITSADINKYKDWLKTNPTENYLVNTSIEESYVKYIASNFTRLF